MHSKQKDRKRIIIIGGGFAGLEAAMRLRSQPADVLLLDRNNYFTFQPLLYQVAMGGLEPNSVAYPLRRIFKNTGNVKVRVAEVEGIAPDEQQVYSSIGKLPYDYLVIATGSRPQFFGLNKDHLLPLKTVPDSLRLRNWILRRFEEALVEKNERKREALFNFIVVGGGPTGVELAGALSEMKRWVLPKDYPDLETERMQIYLLEGLNRLLPSMSQKASRKALQYLDKMGVHIGLNKLVSDYDGRSIKFGNQHIPSRNIIWTAGVEAAPPEGFSEKSFAIDRRLVVDLYSRVRGTENIFAVGDVALMPTDNYPEGHPMLAPVAMQQGEHLGRNLVNIVKGKAPKAFKYSNYGVMATIGRNKAVADLPGAKIHGFPAWLAWMAIHLFKLVGFRNKLIVIINWIYNYFTYDKALRLILTKPKEEKAKFNRIKGPAKQKATKPRRPAS